MPFPKAVKTEALVASARHCCVCHKSCGVGVEVHHIVQEADSGANDLDNAIALCFDCHAAAGHYNDRHPRGTKYSPGELRAARDRWHEIVRSNGIEAERFPDDVVCKYFLCKNFENLKSISALSLDDFPIDNSLLIRTDALSALDELLTRHPAENRSLAINGIKHENEHSFFSAFPKKDQPEGAGHDFPYYERMRQVKDEDLELLKRKDGLVAAMAEYGLPSQEIIAITGIYESACDGTELQEEILLRPIWGLFFTIENRSDEPLYLENLSNRRFRESGFEKFSEIEFQESELILPRAPIPPKASVVIPTAVVVPPLRPLRGEAVWTDIPESKNYQLAISYCTNSLEHLGEMLTFGTVLQPGAIQYRKAGKHFFQPVHEFDFTSYYEIDRNWAFGSCPHLFYVNDDKTRFTYERELLENCESQIGSDFFLVPEGATGVIIAELEPEVTEICSIQVNGFQIGGPLTLSSGEEISFKVSPGDKVEIIGQYSPVLKSDVPAPVRYLRNSLIFNFLRDKESTLAI